MGGLWPVASLQSALLQVSFIQASFNDKANVLLFTMEVFLHDMPFQRSSAIRDQSCPAGFVASKLLRNVIFEQQHAQRTLAVAHVKIFPVRSR